MGKSFWQYAEENHNPEAQTEAERADMAANAKYMEDAASVEQRAEELKQCITLQLEERNAPQCVLYSAIKCIGILSNDPDWAAAAENSLNSFYGDISQISTEGEDATIAAARMNEQYLSYRTKIDKQTERLLKNLETLLDELKYTRYVAVSLPEPPEGWEM